MYHNIDIIDIFEEFVRGTDKSLKIMYGQMDYVLVKGNTYIDEYGDLLEIRTKDPILMNKEAVYFIDTEQIKSVCVIDNIDDIIKESKDNWMNMFGINGE